MTTPMYTCATCGAQIQGLHLMTIATTWLQSGGWGTPPAEAIVHVCNQHCARRSAEFTARLAAVERVSNAPRTAP